MDIASFILGFVYAYAGVALVLIFEERFHVLCCGAAWLKIVCMMSWPFSLLLIAGLWRRGERQDEWL